MGGREERAGVETPCVIDEVVTCGLNWNTCVSPLGPDERGKLIEYGL